MTQVTDKERLAWLTMSLMRNGYYILADANKIYDVDVRTYQRDNKAILNAASEHHLNLTIKKDRQIDGYRWEQADALTDQDIFALLKMLVGTRSLEKQEMMHLKDHLIGLLSPAQVELIEPLIESDVAHYNSVKSNEHLLDRLLQFAQYQANKTNFKYTYQGSTAATSVAKAHAGVILNIYFAEHYYYCLVYDADLAKVVIRRVDRFVTIKEMTTKRITIPRADRPDVNRLRDKTYLLSGGSEINLEFWYQGYPQTALDRFPNAEIDERKTQTHEREGVYIKCKNVSWQGAKLWILGQGTLAHVTLPQAFKTNIQETLRQNLAQYE